MTQKHCLEYIVNQEGEGGLAMMNPSFLGRCLRSRVVVHSLLLISCVVTRVGVCGLCKAKSTETLAVSVRLFPGCRKPLIFMGIVFPNLYSHIFQSIPSSLRDRLFQIDGWAESPPHSRLPMGHLPAQPQARREPASTATGLQRLP